ncbi:hypothetical protein K438DRAFT_1993555 [Mycena galopus ATCC 62051]|nr:hypothetical protein K438DRAFT_1993555 [Mycena galopus ATCC 62051]
MGLDKALKIIKQTECARETMAVGTWVHLLSAVCRSSLFSYSILLLFLPSLRLCVLAPSTKERETTFLCTRPALFCISHADAAAERSGIPIGLVPLARRGALDPTPARRYSTSRTPAPRPRSPWDMVSVLDIRRHGGLVMRVGVAPTSDFFFPHPSRAYMRTFAHPVVVPLASSGTGSSVRLLPPPVRASALGSGDAMRCDTMGFEQTGQALLASFPPGVGRDKHSVIAYIWSGLQTYRQRAWGCFLYMSFLDVHRRRDFPRWRIGCAFWF